MDSAKIGITLDIGYSEPASERLSMARNAGFDAFFINWKPGVELAPLADQAVKEGCYFQSVHAPYGKVWHLWHGTEEAANDALDELITCIRLTREAGVDCMVLHPFIGFNDHTPTEQGLSYYDRIIEEAARYNVTAALENVEGPEYIASLMEHFRDNPYVRFCWDCGHERVYNGCIDQLALYGDRLVATHLNDNFGQQLPNVIRPEDDTHLLPFDGSVDWASIMARLDAVNYNNIYTFELRRIIRPDMKTGHEKELDWSAERFFNESYLRAKRVVDRTY